MPFRSKRQWRAAMAGKIEGISKSDAHDWAHETSTPFKDLPDRAPAEKGKPTLRSKKADYLDDKEARRKRQGTKHAYAFEPLEQELAEVFKFAAFRIGLKPKQRTPDPEILAARRAHPMPTNVDWDNFDAHKDVHPAHWVTKNDASYDKMRAGFEARKARQKVAVLGTAVSNPNNVGKLKGMMSTHALKAPGYAAATQAMNPRKNIVAAMNKIKPH